MALAKNTGSILDSVVQEMAGLAGTLGPADQTKLNEYFDSVRDMKPEALEVRSRSVQKIDRSVLGGFNVVRAVRPIEKRFRVRVVDQFVPTVLERVLVQRCMAVCVLPVKGRRDSQAALR